MSINFVENLNILSSDMCFNPNVHKYFIGLIPETKNIMMSINVNTGQICHTIKIYNYLENKIIKEHNVPIKTKHNNNNNFILYKKYNYLMICINSDILCVLDFHTFDQIMMNNSSNFYF